MTAIAFERSGGSWRSIGSEMCTFMPLRGIADDARLMVPLTPDWAVTLQINQEQVVDTVALSGVLDQPSTQTWTGVKFRGPESQEYMDLWLACTMDNALSRMTVEQSAFDSGLVKKPFRQLAVSEKGDLAYLIVRPVECASDGGQLYEVGVIGHGPSSYELAGRVVDEIRTWNRDYRSRTVAFEIQPADAEPIAPAPGEFAFDTPLHRLVIAWQ